MMKTAFIASACLLLSLVGMTTHAIAITEGKPQARLKTVTLRAGVGSKIIAEVAKRPGEMAMGLMFRKSLGDNEGMLFVFEKERRASFWMANTSIPLTIAYLDREGKILELHDLKPFDMTPVLSESDRVAFALEMNRGWFKANRINPGDKIVPVNTTWARLRAPLGSQPQFDR